jgi:hypothetical protein
MKRCKRNIRFFGLLILVVASVTNVHAGKFVVLQSSPKVITPNYFSSVPTGGDTIYISSERTLGLKFQNFYGNESRPIVFINYGGQVNINDLTYWGALTFENCQYIKVTGTGYSAVKYGFKLAAQTSGLTFCELSSDCEADHIEIDHKGFFGIYAKKDYSGNPPTPRPVFNNLIIHDTYISHVSEGMYLGETKSPGMEFHHVRVYNNIVKNTGREGIQVANMVEDVEIYNNVIINSGLEHETYQTNNFQIGDNTVGKYYNNIFISAPAWGIITMGSGDIEISNNYLESNTGVFIDNRIFTTLYAPIAITKNYFLKTNNTNVLLNYNELNPIIAANNRYDGSCPFMISSTASQPNIISNNNQQASLQSITFQDTVNYLVSSNSVYKNMGPTATMVPMNDWPVLDSLKANYYTTFGKTTLIPLHASVADGDGLSFSIDSLPPFVSLTDSINGYAVLKLLPTQNNVGTHTFLVSVSDASHHASDRQLIQVTVAPPTNHCPEMKPVSNITVNNLQETVVPIYVSDLDSDPLALTLLNDLDFITINSVNDSTFNLVVKPKYLETGDYSLNLSLTDSLSKSIIYTIPLHVKQLPLSSNTPIYRLDCGGYKNINADNLDWEPVRTGFYGKKYVATSSWETGSSTYKGINNTTAPNSVFGSYNYDYPGNTELQWKFPVTNGKYKVNLFFRERQSDITNDGSKAIFNVSIEDTKVLSNFCIFDENGENPLQKTFETTVKDRELSINFFQIAGKPKISAIEVIFLEAGNMPPVIDSINNVQMNEGETSTIPLQITDDAAFVVSTSSITAANFPSFASLKIDKQNNRASITLSPDFSGAGTYKNLLIKASDGEFSDSTLFDVVVANRVQPNYPNWSIPDALALGEGETKTITNIAFDPENDLFTVTAVGPGFVSVQKDGSGWNLKVAPDYNNAGTYTVYLTATDQNNYTSKDSIFISVQNVNPQIILTPGMITDEVSGGSIDSPNYLVDEQNLTPENAGVPISKSWKPAYNATNAPYNVTIDLGAVYDLTKIALHDMNDMGPLVISTVNSGKWQELYTEVTDFYNTWKTKDVSITARYIRLTLNAGSGAFINEISLFGTKVMDEAVQKNKDYLKPEVIIAEQTVKQIILSPAMITDEVKGGSIDSPTYLVDEQNLNIDRKEHAVSKSWKPYYNSTKAPYNTTIDLGSEYVIKKICFHDMNNTGPMIISYGEPGNWTVLYTENFSTYNNWLTKEVGVQTRYLRLTLEAGSGAFTNELMVFGYATGLTDAVTVEKSAVISNTISENTGELKEVENLATTTDSFDLNQEEVTVYPTIFSQDLHLQIKDGQNDEYTISLIKSNGQLIVEDHVFHSSLTTKSYSTSQWNLSPGIYIMKIKRGNLSTSKTFKLIKT